MLAELHTEISFSVEFGKMSKILCGFRRHPDWKAAFQVAIKKYCHLFEKTDDGLIGLPEKNIGLLFDLADQEFIDELVRRGY